MKWLSRLFVICIAGLLGISGCATLSPQTPQTDDQEPEAKRQEVTLSDNQLLDQQGWWRVSFHRTHRQEDEVMWHLDTLLAYLVVKPALDESQQVKLWRFHRRAREDSAGHNFSFIFYTSRSEAAKIYRQVNDNSIVKELLDTKYIDRLTFVDINSEEQSDIAATSDSAWPLELQKAWPYFIMGASQSWLALVDELYRQQQQSGEELVLAQQIKLFKLINDKINKMWEQQGHHAFLHHLNALFGYQELYILDRRKMRF